jgi:carbon monoxide dehydrogenase subunit G
MIVEERFAIGAPPDDVWRFFLDVPRAATCMPGVERVEQIDERNYRGNIQVKIGPLKAGFTMDVAFDDLRPPEQIRVSARGADRGTSSTVDAKATIVIQPGDERRSDVTLTVDLALRGPLGRFGQVIIQDTVRKLTAQFVACAEQEALR